MRRPLDFDTKDEYQYWAARMGIFDKLFRTRKGDDAPARAASKSPVGSGDRGAKTAIKPPPDAAAPAKSEVDAARIAQSNRVIDEIFAQSGIGQIGRSPPPATTSGASSRPNASGPPPASPGAPTLVSKRVVVEKNERIEKAERIEKTDKIDRGGKSEKAEKNAPWRLPPEALAGRSGQASTSTSASGPYGPLASAATTHGMALKSVVVPAAPRVGAKSSPSAVPPSSVPPPAAGPSSAATPAAVAPPPAHPSATPPSAAPPSAGSPAAGSPAAAAAHRALSGRPPQAEGGIVDEILKALERAFDDASPGARVEAEEESTESGAAGVEPQVAELFAKIAGEYAQPIRDFIVEVKAGTATKEWIDICRPALRSILKASRSMRLDEAAKAMDDFDSSLSGALASRENVLSRFSAEHLLSCYQRMAQVMPSTFELTRGTNSAPQRELQRGSAPRPRPTPKVQKSDPPPREPSTDSVQKPAPSEEVTLPEASAAPKDLRKCDSIILNSLLKQIPGVGKVTLDKIYAAGLLSLSAFGKAMPGEVAATTGVPFHLCQQICARLAEYIDQSASGGPTARLHSLVDELESTNTRLEKAQEEAAPSEKRDLRTLRANSWLAITTVLAELGELGLVSELERFPIGRRIQFLKKFLSRS